MAEEGKPAVGFCAEAFSSGKNRGRMNVHELEELAESQGLSFEHKHVQEALKLAGYTPTSETITIPQDPNNILNKLIENNLAVSDWNKFTGIVEDLYSDLKINANGGHNATYIPVLAEQDPSWFGVSVCTVDGQRFDIGDVDVDFSIQSCVKPLMYAAAVEDVGLTEVHRHVGIEPSGLAFNEVSLNSDNLPHNPMINAGAIATGSCIRPGLDMAGRFKFFMEKVKALAGGERVGFSQPTYLCEHETAWRNNALLYYMQEAGVFSKEVSPAAVLDFYIQCCAIEVNSVSASVIAATLANGGVCPLNGEQIVTPATVKSCLTLMFSCGMYDYSGEWCVQVGLPAKSGVAGLVYVVIPNVMGIAIFSPPLDSHGNSVKGVAFAEGLLRTYPFGIFDDFVNSLANAGAGEGPVAPPSPPHAARTHPEAAAKAVEDVKPAELTRGKSKSQHTLVASMHVRQSLVLFGRLHRNLMYIRDNFKPPGKVTPDAPKYYAPLATVKHYLKVAKGVESSKRGNPAVYSMLQAMADASSPPGFVSMRELLAGDNLSHNTVVRALLGELIFNDYSSFVENMDQLFADASHTPVTPAEGLTHIQREVRAMSCTAGQFAMSVCTVDGQQYSCGDVSAAFPIMETCKPLLYAVGLMDCGDKFVHEWVASEPCAFPADTFNLRTPSTHGGPEDDETKDEDLPSRRVPSHRAHGLSGRGASDSDSDEDSRPTRASSASSIDMAVAPAGKPMARLPSLPKIPGLGLASPPAKTGEEGVEHREPGDHTMPYNPFMDSGSMVVCSLIGRGHAKKRFRKFHDAGSRFTHVLTALQRMAGGQKIGFNNPVFLALKQRGLKTLAVSHFMKGMGCYPPRTQPTDMAQLYFQSCATEMTVSTLAVIASTLANAGVCPLTQTECLRPSVVKNVLSLLYSCGMSTHTGVWSFYVGLPSTTGSTGATLVVIPKVMGMVLYQPDINATGLSPKVEAFCRALTKRYCVNIWDQLVNQNGNITLGNAADDNDEGNAHRTTLLFFNMCTAVQHGNLSDVLMYIRDGADCLRADYDKRTALHIGACEGHLDVCKALVQAGADVLAKDRWGKTPLDEARTLGRPDLVDYFEDVFRLVAVRPPGKKSPSGASGGAGVPSGSPDSGTSGAPAVGFINLARNPSGKLKKMTSFDWK